MLARSPQQQASPAESNLCYGLTLDYQLIPLLFQYLFQPIHID